MPEISGDLSSLGDDVEGFLWSSFGDYIGPSIHKAPPAVGSRRKPPQSPKTEGDHALRVFRCACKANRQDTSCTGWRVSGVKGHVTWDEIVNMPRSLTVIQRPSSGSRHRGRASRR